MEESRILGILRLMMRDLNRMLLNALSTDATKLFPKIFHIAEDFSFRNIKGILIY